MRTGFFVTAATAILAPVLAAPQGDVDLADLSKRALNKRCGEMINSGAWGSFPNCFGACASDPACSGGSGSSSGGSSTPANSPAPAADSPAPAADTPAAAATSASGPKANGQSAAKTSSASGSKSSSASGSKSSSASGSKSSSASGSKSSSASTSGGGNYKLSEDYFDGDFFSHFDFFTGSDPTHGLVEFVSQSEAQSSGLINSTSNSAWMGADSTTKLSGNTGRKAVRVSSKKSYTHMLIAIDVGEIPVSCGGWPAFWTFGPNWPNQGEIDIIEGVHTQGGNQMTLHTSSGCNANGAGDGLLQPVTQSCEGNTGCGFKETNDDSWQNANKVGGGVWAMEWNSDGISVWWWGGSNKTPSDVFGDSPNPKSWGKPSMNVPNSGCNIDQYFKNHNIVFDWTFCGDWAGADGVWSSSGCSSSQYPTCQSYVQGNPSAYAGVGFDVKQLKVYTAN